MSYAPRPMTKVGLTGSWSNLDCQMKVERPNFVDWKPDYMKTAHTPRLPAG